MHQTSCAQPSPDLDALTASLTIEDCVALMAGADFWTTVPIERLGIPAVKVSDGPNGARGAGTFAAGTPATAFPCAIALGAGWNPDAARQMGSALAGETRSKGARALLAPTVNIHRSGLSGRNFECYSEDPHLTSALAVSYIGGLQDSGVAATIKHFVANDSEVQRTTISSNVAERALREIYLQPFEAAVKKAGVWSIMTGYNRLNGTHMDSHAWAMTEVARQEWGFDGIFISDWFGTNSTVESALAGLDIEMPGAPRFRGDKLLAAVKSGEVPQTLLRQSARRILGFLDRVGALASAGPEAEHCADLPRDRALVRRLGADGAVLLKNNRSLLPLASGTSLAVIGPNAKVARMMGGGSAQINAPHRISPLDGLAQSGHFAKVDYELGCSNNRLVKIFAGEIALRFYPKGQTTGRPLHVSSEAEADFFWFDMPFEQGQTLDFTAVIEARFRVDHSGDYLLGMVNSGSARAFLDGVEVLDGETGWQRGENFFGYGNDERRATVALQAGREYTLTIRYDTEVNTAEGIVVRGLRFGLEKPTDAADIAAAVALAQARDVAVLCVGRQQEWDTEGLDLKTMELPGDQLRLIEAVAAVNRNTVVVLQTGGPIEMPWLDKVAAVVQFWYPGQEAGHAIADVLSGAAIPGGRLPQSFPKAMKDTAVWSDSARTYPGEDGEVDYAEGVFVGYRHHDARGPAPLFPFGFGLGYSEIAWGEVAASATGMTEAGITVSVPLRNIGARAAVEVVQLYVVNAPAPVPRPVKELRAFAKRTLAPGESGLARLTVMPRDLAYFCVERHAWVAPAGDYALWLGAHAQDCKTKVAIRLETEQVFAV